MDAPLASPHELIRPWRRATIAASLIAAVELVLLLGAGALLLAKPVSHALRHRAVAAATTAAPSKELTKPIRAAHAPAGKALPPSHVGIMVLNGNGVDGAAAATASRLHGLGYRIAGTANAEHEDYATSVVMYKTGFRAEGLRLARTMHIAAVGPLDGIEANALGGGQLVVIVGA